MIDFYPPVFNDVPFGTLEKSECSPQVEDPAFKGFVIRLPERIKITRGDDFALPICGYYVLPTGPLVAGGKMHIYVENISEPSVAPLSIEVFKQGDPDGATLIEPPEREPVDPEMYKNQISESYFYLNAEYYFAEPLPAGVYNVRMSYGGVYSNKARVELVVE